MAAVLLGGGEEDGWDGREVSGPVVVTARVGVAGDERREAAASKTPVRAQFVGPASLGDLGGKKDVKRVWDGKGTNF